MALYKNESLDHSLTEPVKLSTRVRLSLAERKVLLWLGDVVITGLASIGALWLWTFTRPHPFTLDFLAEQANWIPILILAWTLVAWALDLYNPRLAPQIQNVMRRLLGVATVILIGYLLIFFIIAPSNMLPRRPLLYFLLLALVGCGLWRWAYATTLARGALRQRLLIVGAGQSGQTLVATIQDKFAAEFEVLGFLDDDLANQQIHIGDVLVLGETSDVLKIAHERGADTIVYAITQPLQPELFHVLLHCQATGLPVIQMPALYEVLTERVPVEHVRNDWLLPSEVSGGQASLTYRLFVHLVDWSFGLLAGLFMLVVGPVVALLIRLDSPGPIFYRQVRLGRGGTPFELLKFRSMVIDAEEGTGPKWATLNDPRVTGVGRFLRITRLDELPQVLNILKGDIHLIGPRPERPELIAELEQAIPFYRARLAVKPGLTGWAQVKYRYGSTVEDAVIKLEYDLYYIKNRSIPLDLSILLKTIGVILLFKGT